MEPDQVTSEVQSIAADTSPEANSELGSISSECPAPIVNVGIFFDGTYNNAYDTTIRKTNVYRLSRHYKTPVDDIYSASGSCLQEAFRPVYIQGVGSTGNALSGPFAGSTGLGIDGVFDRMEQATNFLRQTVESFGGIDGITELRVDIFGFSRGAATARIYANALADAGIDKLRIRFLGLFDTVGSFGIPGDASEGYISMPRSTAGRVGFFLSPSIYALFNQGELDMNIHANTTEKAFQITAQDEFRAFFPLSRIKPAGAGQCVEVGCPGNHGDIGGSEVQEPVTEHYTNQDMNRWQFLRERGWVEAAERTYWEDRRDNRRTAGWNREVLPGLTRVSLKAMHAQAHRNQVPIHPLSSARAGDDITIDGDQLNQLAATLSGGGTPDQAMQRWIRARYAHRSWGGPGPNMLDINHLREEYPNRP